MRPGGGEGRARAQATDRLRPPAAAAAVPGALVPFAPECQQHVRHPAAQRTRAVDAGVAGGAERDERTVIPGPAVVHMQNLRGPAGAALPAVAA